VNTYAWVLLVALAVAAAADWVAVAQRWRPVEEVVRPAYVLLLLALSYVMHADETLYGRWLLAGLGFALAGDILQLVRSDQAFGFGLLAYLSAYLCFTAVLLTMALHQPVWPGVAAAMVALICVVTFVLWPLARADVREGAPPTVYAFVLGVFVALSWWAGNLLAAVGASLFVVSDAVLAAGRFWREFRGGIVLAMGTHQLALLLLVLGGLRPDLVGS
jgi:uncharacterized membrane protein YhhN